MRCKLAIERKKCHNCLYLVAQMGFDNILLFNKLKFRFVYKAPNSLKNITTKILKMAK